MIWYQQLTMLTDFRDWAVPVIDVPNCSDWRLKQSHQRISTTRFIIIRHFFNLSTNWSRLSIIFNSTDCFTDSSDGDAYESSPSDSSMKMCDVETAHPIEETALTLQQICIDGSQDAWCRNCCREADDGHIDMVNCHGIQHSFAPCRTSRSTEYVADEYQ